MSKHFIRTIGGFTAVAAVLLTPVIAQTPLPPPSSMPKSVQVTLTVADASADITPNFPELGSVKNNVRDDLAALQQEAQKQKITLQVVSSLTCTATNGIRQVCSVQRPVYYTTSSSGNRNSQTFSVALNDGLTVKPHFNEDGTITAEFSVVDSRIADAAWKGIGTPTRQIVSFNTKHTFHSGDTVWISGGSIPKSQEARFYLATVTVLPLSIPPINDVGFVSRRAGQFLR